MGTVKGENKIMKRKNNKITETRVCYVMSRKMFKAYLLTRNEAEKKQNPYQYVMDCLNSRGDLIGKVTSIQVVGV